MNRWVSMVAIALTLAACDGGSSGTDGGTEPGMDGGTSPGTDGGAPSTEVAGECTEVCEADDDCADELGCVDRRCACTTDERCQIGADWTQRGCTSNGDCASSLDRCIEWGDTTYCVIDRSSSFNCGIGSSESKVEVDLADGSGTIEICVNTDRVCREDGTCGGEAAGGCEDDADCATPGLMGLPHCDVASGRCVCVEDPEDSCTARHPATQCRADGECGCLEDDICPSETGGHCDIATGTCGCLSTDDCNPGDVCHEGQCRCTVAAGCGAFLSPTNPGTTLECVPL